jgi:alkylation response protein AidB-like acyl-CoA dehydrogenase
MQILYSFEEHEIQKAVRKFVKKDLLPISKEVDSTGEFPSAVKAKFLSMGLLRTAFPEEYGGVNGTFTGLIMALKALSYASLVPGWIIFENFLLAYPLLHYGSPLLKTRFLPSLISLEAVGALAFTEPDTGSDPTQLKTVARKEEGGWTLNGSKRFITHSGICDQMILFARTGDSVTAFLVESRKSGYRAGKRETFMQAHALDNGEVYLEDYVAAHGDVIGEPGQGFEILLKTEAMGKIAFCSLFAGLAERAVDLAIQYANTRSHRGKAIGHKFQMTQFKLARMMTKLEALNAYLFHVCAKVDGGEDIFWDAANLKLLVAQAVKAITSDAMEIHGAYGLSEEYEIGRLYRTAISAQVVMGSLDIQRVIVAKGVLEKGGIERNP